MSKQTDPVRHVVNPFCETYDVYDLYVCDTCDTCDTDVFHTRIGVNPMEPIMAFADYTDQQLKQR